VEALRMLTAVDDLLRSLYAYLSAADQCFFLREYTSGAASCTARRTASFSTRRSRPIRLLGILIRGLSVARWVFAEDLGT
jgi:hypothetical protein